MLVHNNNSKKNIKLISSSYYRKLMHYYYHCTIPLCFFIRASLLHASGWRGKDLNLCSGIMLTTISLGILVHVLPSYETIHEKREAFHFHSFQFFHKFLIVSPRILLINNNMQKRDIQHDLVLKGHF